MKQHAVPQNITSYEFQLIGSMTLKQFAFLAGPVLLAVLIYFLPLIPYLKWPLIVFLVMLGVGLAFLPINDVPLDRWITAFFRAVTKPTVFIYRKKGWHMGYIDFQPKEKTKRDETVPIDKVTIAEYLKTLPSKDDVFVSMDENEKQIEKINKLFDLANIPVGEVKIKQMKGENKSQTIVIDTKHDHLAGQSLPGGENNFFRVNLGNSVRVVPKLNSVKIRRLGTRLAVPSNNGTVESVPIVPAKIQATTPKPTKPVTQQVPKTPVGITLDVMASVNNKSTVLTGAKKVFSEAARVQINLPAAPTIPNVITGVVVDKTDKLVEGAIVEVKTVMTDQIVRVMKTNKLGRFWLATPLQTGKYKLVVESEGKNFAIIPFEAKGKIIKPFKIAAYV